MSEKKKKILCMYSGGLDSVGNLYRLLTAPEFADFGIHVHHLSLKNLENRAAAEYQAVTKTLSYFKNYGYRDFFVTNSLHDYSFLNQYFIYDTFWTAFMAANIITADPSIVHVAVGRNKTDSTHQDGYEYRVSKGHEIFETVLPPKLKGEVSYIYPVVEMTKEDIWEMLPPEVRVLSWSCRRPTYDKDGLATPCGKCKTCIEMLDIDDAKRIQQNF